MSRNRNTLNSDTVTKIYANDPYSQARPGPFMSGLLITVRSAFFDTQYPFTVFTRGIQFKIFIKAIPARNVNHLHMINLYPLTDLSAQSDPSFSRTAVLQDRNHFLLHMFQDKTGSRDGYQIP